VIGTSRQRLYLGICAGVFIYDVIVAAVAKPCFALTMNADAVPCILLVVAILAVRENFQTSSGILPVFWRVFAVGLGVMLISQAFWFYFDWRRQTAAPSPVPGDALFLVAFVFFLSALALRPCSGSARFDLRLRSLDFLLLSLWWLFLYAYFALPWETLAGNLDHYNLDYSALSTMESFLVVATLGTFWLRKQGAWRRFYFVLMVAFLFFCAGNLLMNNWLIKIYYPGGLYDIPFLLALCLFTLVACYGSSLQPEEASSANRELVLSVWIARFAILVLLALPVLALWSLCGKHVPPVIELFRLRLVFGSIFVLGGLVYWKFNLLTRELVRLVHLTSGSIEHLKDVEKQVNHSEKLVALGRLAAGAAHEISNPLTAILGYSELLADIPSLSPEDRSHAQDIREQVHRAQAAVASLRRNMNPGALQAAMFIDKKSLS
jgi:hypothetical protein